MDDDIRKLGPIDAIARKTARWGVGEWIFTGLILQIILIFGGQALLDLLPEKEDPEINLEMAAELSFVEFNEIKADVTSETQDLSDKIIEKDKITKEQPINWNNAADPAMDFDQRYSARLLVNISPNDYPTRARRANVGRVTVAVSIYIAANGRIRDVKIRDIRSQGGTAANFKGDFVTAVRKILLQKTKLLNSPYKQSGVAKDFVWDTTVTFTLQ